MKVKKVKRPRIAPEVWGIIASLYLKNPDWTSEQIRRHLEGLPKRTWPVPSLRSVQKIVAQVKKKAGSSEFRELDRPWSVGVSLNHNIPSDMIPILIDIQFAPEALTIREARWFTLLYPILKPRVETKLTELTPKQQRGKIILIANQYAKAEQIAEITGRDLDTTRLDYKYFREGDFSAEGVIDNLLDLILWKREEKQNERQHNQALRE